VAADSDKIVSVETVLCQPFHDAGEPRPCLLRIGRPVMGGAEQSRRTGPYRELEVYLNGQWLCTAIPQDALGPAEREAVLARRREDAKELARRRRRVRRAARERLAPLTAHNQQVEDITVIGRAQADREQRRHDDAALARLARTDLLGLEAIGEQIEARNRAKLAAHPWLPPRQLPAGDEHDAEHEPQADD
jgi:hypothetical protein